jgi:osmotically-inducible protein OsmY
MYRLSISPRTLTLLAALTMTAALDGCTRRDDSQTAGQKVDAAVSKADQKLDEAKASAEKAISDAKTATTDAMSSAATVVNDTAITAAVKSSLSADAGLKASELGVETREGRVTLRGMAADNSTRERAVQLATAVKGVVGVDDQLTVAR